jgi:hypothetical protein
MEWYLIAAVAGAVAWEAGKATVKAAWAKFVTKAAAKVAADTDKPAA